MISKSYDFLFESYDFEIMVDENMFEFYLFCDHTLVVEGTSTLSADKEG